jgi:hypothetical protein
MDATPLAIDSLNAIKSAAELYLAQYYVADRLWMYFAVVTLAVVGFSVASERASRSFLEAAVILVTYVVFAVANFHALTTAQAQLIQFAALARRVADEHALQIPAWQRAPLAEEACFYWAVVIGVCVAILLITQRRRSYERQSSIWP